MTDDRSERLRRRRNRSQQAAGADDTGDEAGTETDDEAGREADRDEGGSIKQQRHGIYMYLPDDQLGELRRAYNVIKAEYEVEVGQRFEKNRHFYPLVVQHGLDRLVEMDVTEINRLVEDL